MMTPGALEVSMRLHFEKALLVLAVFFSAATLSAQQIGKYVPVSAGSDADRAMAEINSASDPAQNLAQKQYDKAFEYGDKLFAIDPGNFQNAMNMIRAASEKGDTEKLLAYGEKTQSILAAFKSSRAPSSVAAETWEQQKTQTIASNQDNIRYVQQAVYNGAYQTQEPAKRADRLLRFAKIFPDSEYSLTALGVAASSYQKAQNAPKMLEVAN